MQRIEIRNPNSSKQPKPRVFDALIEGDQVMLQSLDELLDSELVRSEFLSPTFQAKVTIQYFIGNPQYIQLFINRDKNSLFIKGCDTKEPHSFAVPVRVYADSEYKYRLTKSAFTEAIGTLLCWDNQGKYKLYGLPYAERIVRFSLESAERLDGDAEI